MSSSSDHTPISDGYKRCTKCGKIKPATLEYFNVGRNYHGGLRSSCKECRRAEYWANPEKARKQTIDWRREHPGYDTKKSRHWRLNNLERDREIKANWIKTHPEYGAINRENRRARKVSLPARLTLQEWARCLNYWQDKCAVCGRHRGLWHTIAADHWIPLISPSCPGTIATNTVPLCHGIDGCNNSKNSCSPVEWLTDKFGPRKAKKILARIEAYFAWVKEQDA